jgi:hypothetical protein
MAKAGKKRTHDDELARAKADLDATLKRLGGSELHATLKRLGKSEFFQNLRAQWAHADKERLALQKASKAIDRAIAIETGMRRPPWMEKPRPPVAGPPTDTGAWIAAEARRMKTAGKDFYGGSKPIKSNFAKTLAKQMDKAARSGKSIHPVGWRHIYNNLQTWDLWPTSKI